MQLRSHIENIQWLLLLIFMSAPQSSKGDLPTPPEVSYSIDGWLEAGAFL
jgi:hypothetical protein